MKLLTVLATLSTGGAAVVHRVLADRLSDRGVQVDVFSYRTEGWETIFGAYPRERIVFQRETTLTELLCREDYDIIHGISDAPDHGLGRSVALARCKAPVVLTCHGYEVPRSDISFVDAFVTVSEAMAEEVRSQVSVPVRVIHNGVDETLFAPGPAEKGPQPVVLWIGRLQDSRKDFVGFASLAGSMLGDKVDFWIAAACPSDYPVTLDAWAPGRVTVLRHLSQAEMADVYRRTAASGGCVVFTSLSEGLPMSILEALACGCPVVAPNVGGIAEVLDKSNGRLYDRGLGAGRLREMVLEVLRGGCARERIVEEGLRTVAERFTSSQMTQRYMDLFEELLRNHNGAAPGLRDRLVRRGVGAMCRLKASVNRCDPG